MRIPDTRNIDYLGKCVGEGCISLSWGVIGSEDRPWVNNTIQYLSQKGNMTIEDDFKFVYKSTDLLNFFLKTGNDIKGSQVAVLFCTDYFEVVLPNSTEAPHKVNCEHNTMAPNIDNFIYWIFYNGTLTKTGMPSSTSSPAGINDISLSTKKSVDEAIYKYIDSYINNKPFNEGKEFALNFTTADFPVAPNRFFNNFETASNFTGFWYFVPIMISFLAIVQEIVNEKERELRKG